MPFREMGSALRSNVTKGTLDIQQERDPVSLQAAMKCRASQVWDGRLQGIEAVVQRQEPVAPKRDGHCFLRLDQDRGARLLRASLHILDRRTLPGKAISIGEESLVTEALTH